MTHAQLAAASAAMRSAKWNTRSGLDTWAVRPLANVPAQSRWLLLSRQGVSVR